jgi:hypothetical protein
MSNIKQYLDVKDSVQSPQTDKALGPQMYPVEFKVLCRNRPSREAKIGLPQGAP